MLNVSGSLFLLLHVSVDISHGKFISRKSSHMHHTNFPGYYGKRVPYNHTLRKLKGQHSKKKIKAFWAKKCFCLFVQKLTLYLFCRHTIFCSFELWIVLLQTKNHTNGILLKNALTCRLNNLSVIDLSILRDACCELFCVFRDFNATGMQGTGPGVTNSLFIRRCCKLSGKYILWDLSQWDMAISYKESKYIVFLL